MLVFEGISTLQGKTRVREIAGMECCLAAWAARAPEPEPMAKVARRLESRLSPATQAAIRELDAKVAGWPLRALNAFYRMDVEDFGEALDLIEAEPPRRLALDLLLGSVSRADRLPPANGGDPLAAAIDSGYISSAAQRGMRMLLRQPERTVTKVVEVLRAFWESGFAEIWERERKALAQRSAPLESVLMDNLGAGLSNASPRGFYDAPENRLMFLGGQGTKIVRCSELKSLDVIPSLWLRRRVVLAYGPGRVAIGMGCGLSPSEEFAVNRIPKVLAVLGDSRRFEIVRLCLIRAHSTKELAAHLKITEGPVSRHLKELESHGLLVGQRYGREVTYATVPETMALLANQLTRLPLEATSG